MPLGKSIIFILFPSKVKMTEVESIEAVVSWRPDVGYFLEVINGFLTHC